jgi:LysM repeat protein
MIATLARVMIALVFGTGWAHAGIDRAGTTAANFLSVGSGAGVLGMGGAVLGLGRDLNAAAWNPGALGWVDGTQFVLSHAGLADEQSQEWLATGGRFGRDTRWAVSGLYHGQGSFEGRDASGAPTGTFSATSMALGVQVAQNFGGRGTFGVGAKYVTEDLGTVRGGGFTFDAGGMFQAGRFGFGAAAQNVGGRMSYDDAVYPFPANIGVGGSVAVPEHGLRFALDLNFPSAYYSDARGGVEWMYGDQFALRAGYRAELGAESGEPLGGPSFGMGAGIGGLWFDYGYLISGMAQGGEHRFGMTLQPALLGGAFGRMAQDDPEAAARRAAENEARAAERAAARAAAEKMRLEKHEAEKVRAAEREAAKREAARLAAERDEAATLESGNVPSARAETTGARTAGVTESPAKKAAEAAPKKEAEVAPEKAAETAPKPMPTTHKVADGETLHSIAKRYGTTVPKIMYANNMVNETIRLGQVLKLPKPESR